MIDHAILERMMSDYDEGMQRVGAALRPMLRSLGQLMNDERARELRRLRWRFDHRRRYVMRRKIRKIIR